MTALLAALVAAGIILPHALRLQHVHPVTGVVFWISSLSLRALTGLLAVILLLFFLPRTDAFMAVTHWCLDVAVPLAAVELHVEGHSLADLALFAPGLALATSLVYGCFRTARAAYQAQLLIRREGLGSGPRESIIVSGPEVVFAVAGLIRPRIVVSAGALTWLDDEELEAALDHERAHIVRRHRFVMLLASTSASIGRVVPGTEGALRELAFHLERDADRWALRQRNDRLALASAICKAATGEPPAPPAVIALGSSGVRERLAQLISDDPANQARPMAAALNALATAMVVCTLLLAAVVPTAAAAGLAGDAHRMHHANHCHH